MIGTENKALQKLEDMPLADRIAAVAADVDSKQDEFRSIDAHELASLLGIEDAWHPPRQHITKLIDVRLAPTNGARADIA